MNGTSIARATMPVKSRQLPASLSSKIGQRGDYDPEVAYFVAQRQADAAAQTLRHLVELTYGDDAELVKDQIRQLLRDADDVPDADETSTLAKALASLKAITGFYSDITVQIKSGDFEAQVIDDDTLPEPVNRAALQAAQALRDLIRRVYRDDQVMRVTGLIDCMLDDEDPDENYKQNDAADFYNRVAAQIKDGSFPIVPLPPTIYDLARQAIQTRAAAFPAQNITLYQGRAFHVYVARSQDQLQMVAVNGNPRKAARVQVGQLSPDPHRWEFTLGRSSYDRWVTQARRLQ